MAVTHATPKITSSVPEESVSMEGQGSSTLLRDEILLGLHDVEQGRFIELRSPDEIQMHLDALLK